MHLCLACLSDSNGSDATRRSVIFWLEHVSNVRWCICWSPHLEAMAALHPFPRMLNQHDMHCLRRSVFMCPQQLGITELRFNRNHMTQSIGCLVMAASVGTIFPSFLPQKVSQLQEPAARIMAARIQRLPVQVLIVLFFHMMIWLYVISLFSFLISQTSLCEKPMMTSCVVPQGKQPDSSPILLLHGFDSSCLEWRRTYPLLEEAGLEPWAVDILGWGFSTSEGKVSSFGAKAKTEHLYKFWRTYIKRPVMLVGPSLGGAAAIDLSLTYPEMVSKLVLIDAQGYAEGLGTMTTFPKILAYAGVALLKSVPLRAYANLLIFTGLTYNTLMDSIRVGRLHCLMPGWADALVDFMLSGGYNVASRIPQVKQETLLIWGDQDKIVPKLYAEKFLKDLPNARLEVISNCGHIPHVEKPGIVADLVSRFSSATL